jgi:alpha-tubulin suppressor-like RCC1 family protein
MNAGLLYFKKTLMTCHLMIKTTLACIFSPSSSMTRVFVDTLLILAVLFSVMAANDADAQNCNPLPVAAEKVAWAWGANNLGQLGDGTNVDRHTPVQVQNLSGVTAVAGGYGHALALRTDGTVWAWGQNRDGQLGNGSTVDSNTPVQVQNLSGVTAIAGGGWIALKSDGTVWTWGSNFLGQLGDGTTVDRHTPVQVQNLSGVIAIAASFFHGLAVKADGTVWSWGSNSSGQLGDGTFNTHRTPVQVQDLSGVMAVSATGGVSFALKNDGTVWAWGDNGGGYLGVGLDPAVAPVIKTPMQVLNLSGISAISAGNSHYLALTADCTVWAWGANSYGQIGDGTSNNFRFLPAQIPHLIRIAAIYAGYQYSLALHADGTLWAWGRNDKGQLGNGTTSLTSHTPVKVPTLFPVSAIAAAGVAETVGYGDFTLAVAPLQSTLTIIKHLVHPDHNHLRLFNLKIDGVTVREDINSGSTGPQLVAPGNHTVSETSGTGTSLGAFGQVIGGDCAADGTVSLAAGDQKTCTLTNYDKWGGCPTASRCCEPGEGTQACRRCVGQHQACP